MYMYSFNFFSYDYLLFDCLFVVQDFSTLSSVVHLLGLRDTVCVDIICLLVYYALLGFIVKFFQ